MGFGFWDACLGHVEKLVLVSVVRALSSDVKSQFQS